MILHLCPTKVFCPAASPAAICLHVGMSHPPLAMQRHAGDSKGKVKGLGEGSMRDINALSCWVEGGFEVVRREGGRRIGPEHSKDSLDGNPIKFTSASPGGIGKVGISLTCHRN